MKDNKLGKFLNIFIAIVAVIAAVLFAKVFMVDGDDPASVDGVVSPLVTYSTILLYIAVGVTVLLSLWSMIKNPENLKKTLLGLAVLGVLLVIAYISADSNAVLNAQGGILKDGGEAGSSVNKWVGTGIWYSVILGAIGGMFFVYDLVKGLVKS